MAREVDEARFMRRALQLAARGRGRVEPNPMVGCVLVRGGRIVAEGYHRRFGGPHAEVEALRRCPGGGRGTTAYVTLEPCCFHGKTPPCTEALLAAGVQRVVAAMRDPNPRVAGRGLRLLWRGGVEVSVGLLEEEARALNRPYLKLLRQGRPWVILKWAQSLDGKIATRTGDSKWISDTVQRAHAHRVRGLVDAVIIGRGTAERDDPALTCRLARPRRVAARVVLDSRLRTSRASQLVRTADEVPTWFFCGPSAPVSRRRRLEAAGCRVEVVPPDESGAGVSLACVLDVLGSRQMSNVLVEGGGGLLGRFLDQRLADEIHLYLAPCLVGGSEAPGPWQGRGTERIGRAVRLPNDVRLRRLGSGWFLQVRLGK